MTNEELALQIRAGERGRITELWARVRRFALGGPGGGQRSGGVSRWTTWSKRRL